MPDQKLSVERVDSSEFDSVAKVLAAAYTNDPIHIWAMPKAETRLADATFFFNYYLQRMKLSNRDVFATADRMAVVVTSLVRKGEGGLFWWSSSPAYIGTEYISGKRLFPMDRDIST